MPNLVDIIQVAETLETKPVMVRAERCTAVRNRNSTCKRCIEACPVEGVLAIKHNEISLNGSACVACGACTTVCPTEALSPLVPTDDVMVETVAQACEQSESTTAVIACARMAARKSVDPHAFAQVPCLARVEESLLVNLAARGIDVLLVDGNCRTCRFRLTDKTTDAVVAEANNICEAWGISATVERAGEFPADMAPADERGVLGQARRSFFSSAKDAAKDAAVKTAMTSLKLEQDEPTLQQKLRVGAGRMPQFSVPRRNATLDSLDRFGQPVAAEITTRLWGQIVIDTDVCNGCGMCATFCPTGALVKGDVPKANSSSEMLLEFSCADCVACNLCVDACIKKCIEVSPVIRTADLMDFEPQAITVHKGSFDGRHTLAELKQMQQR